jgi:methylated-DNA-[protein]-cysteine S-methyltransferase
MQTAYCASPWGIWEIIATERGVKSINLLEHAQQNGGCETGLASDCAKQLCAYFEGKRHNFDMPLDWSGAPDFHQRVWLELLKIPYGQTASYGDIAHRLGKPQAVRAVGAANARNPIPIVVPCHRVIGKSGDLTGFAYGLELKRALLALENPMSFAQQGSIF